MQKELIMPKLGESIMEATILKWLKNEGDIIAIEESVLEIATDKVDSEVPSPFSGKLIKRLYNENDVVAIGKAVAIIETEEATTTENIKTAQTTQNTTSSTQIKQVQDTPNTFKPINNGFYSPLVLNIAQQENILMQELASITGTGKDNRVTKKDILDYVSNRKTPNTALEAPKAMLTTQALKSENNVVNVQAPKIDVSGNVEIIEMDRMRRLIADHMVMSKQVSPHVTSFIEADVTNLVNWRNKIKDKFLQREGENITFTPIFVEAISKAIKDYPRINASVDGYNMVIRKDINIGIATALPSGNLIVPVVHNCDRMNLVGITKSINALVNKARNNKLKPEDTQAGTFTLTNVGTFGNVMGTPIISQPQVAILATGAIRKKPAVLELPEGDVIAIRQMMFLSLSYDHRMVDGALGGSFLRRVADYLEQFDTKREF